MRLTSLALMMVLLLTPLSFASAKKSSEGLSVPISGTFTDQTGGIGRFSGTFTISRFAVVSDSIHAVGVITGTLTDSQGNVVATGFQSASLPVTASSGPPAATAGTRDAPAERPVTFMKTSFDSSQPASFTRAAGTAPAPQLSCQILRLSIGAIDLNLLGLTVHLNPVLLIINAVPGPGNLLGNLLCAIVNLLNGGGPLAQLVALLNQLLDLLGGLGG
ncbi:MAG TPA: hypothetical protein VJV03_09620 [Pyrinomonadaceae bacterium]|nr:hypothetical protein [Pyrinomonadaceae bacterium]